MKSLRLLFAVKRKQLEPSSIVPRHGQGLSKRRLKRGRSCGFEDNLEEVEVPKAGSSFPLPASACMLFHPEGTSCRAG